MRKSHWQQNWKKQIGKNYVLILLVVLVFISGVVFGSLAVRTLDEGRRLEMAEFLSNFFNGLTGQIQTTSQVNVMEGIWLNIKFILLIWLLSLSVIGMIGIPILIFLRGFIIGFTVGFLVKELGFKGVVFALASILPQNLILVPVTIIIGIISITFGITMLRSLIGKRPTNFGSYFLNYSSLMVVMVVLLVVASLVETFIAPVFMKMAARFFIAK